MHSAIIAIHEELTGEALEERLEAMMAPYMLRYEGEEYAGTFDYWSIGGRFTDWFSPGYAGMQGWTLPEPSGKDTIAIAEWPEGSGTRMILHPDGRLEEARSSSMFGAATEEECERSSARVRELKEQYPGSFVTVLDAHS